MRKQMIRWLTMSLVLALALGCSKKEEETAPAHTANDNFPQTGSINMGGAGGKATALTADSDDCTNVGSKLGIAGMALGAACHVSEMVESFTTGNNADVNDDGKINCADYDAMTNKDDAGFLLLLLCNKDIIAQGSIKNFGFDNTGSGGAISFEDGLPSDGKTAVGTWTAGSAANYPADIRLWTGTSLSASVPMLGMQLTNDKSGIMMVDGTPFSQNYKIWVQYDYSAADNSKCKAAPSKTNCYWLEAKSSDGGVSTTNDGPPNGFHIIAYAGGLTSADGQPDFLAVQGNYVYSDAKASSIFTGVAGLSSTREIKLKAFVDMTLGQVWGSYEFLDGSAAMITDIGGAAGFGTTLKNGVCQNIGDDDLVTCTVTASNYTSLWDSAFTKVAPTDDVSGGFSFATGKPTAAGLNK